ncbi:S9 family peptidase [Lysobacter sp. 5GHs7-4]|uniref:alpha/beta hydrolase family protein n=1 Tax=Lysobacter sp. 5GHs7-4 TaxID=2904253 RepID=UPI001E5279BA|nr:S9 family peptidase [Lysobacter sp. 5GHs7-4]UHQ22195.1 S9 family peptidase [Lysobacter sp. 5GHs7-4]
MKKWVCTAALAVGLVLAVPALAAVNVDLFVRRDRFNEIKLSPNGEYLAATVPMEDHTLLVVIRRSDGKITADFRLQKNTHVYDFWWVNADRVLLTMTRTHGDIDTPARDGNLFAINADGSEAELLVGQSVKGEGLRTRIQPKKVEAVMAELTDDLRQDDKNVIVSVSHFGYDTYARAEKMDVYTGRRVPMARAPINNAHFVTDNRGVVRFAYGFDTDNQRKLFYRAEQDGAWKQIGDEQGPEGAEQPLGFSQDDKLAYFLAERKEGPDAIVSYDPATGQREQVLRDAALDPDEIIYQQGTIPVGAFFVGARREARFFVPGTLEAEIYRVLSPSFADDSIRITSMTDDRKLALVEVGGGRNPGDFYLYDVAAKKADHVMSRRSWFDPAQMAEKREIALKARDGLELRGYLTLPRGSSGKSLPMVVLPHGGPFGVKTPWGFDAEPQMLASAGYAVLQVDFRGSGGYGRAFEWAGAREWGGKMQDDVTDATRWAMQQGIADPARICIYGTSYGAYAALMGAAKEPGLYKCAAGYAGVYDLPALHVSGAIQRRESGEAYLRDWVGPRDALASVSPIHMADRIKVPVFLAAGGRDMLAPIEHSIAMEGALKRAGVPVETLYYDMEGHGFYTAEHRLEYYTKLLAFLARNLGGEVAMPAPKKK